MSVRLSLLVLAVALVAVASADQSAFRSGSAATAQKRVLIARRKWGALADGAKKLVAMAGVTLRGEGRLGREAAVAKKKIEDDLKEAERVAEEVLQEGLRIAAEVKRAAEENAVIKKLEEGTKAIAASDLVKKLRETELAKAIEAEAKKALKVAEDLKVAGKKAIDDAAKAFQKTKNNIHKGLQKIGTDVVDAVEDVGEKIVNSDVGQFVKGAIQLWTESKASKAVTNVVDCIANKGSAKGGDPTETILRLTENIDKFLKKLVKDAGDDIGKVIEKQFGDGFNKQKNDIQEMFVKLNDPKGIDLKLGDETAECTVATKNTCGKMKCGKMLSSSTGFACCSDSFDYSGTPHCSHDAKLWNTMFTEDNKVNPKVAKMVAKMAVSEGERQIKALQNSAAIEPEFKCMIEHVLIPARPGLEEYLSGMLIKAISEMTKVSEELFGGKKLEDFVHKTISAAFGGAKNLEMAGREVDKVKGIVEGAVNKMCEQVMVTAASAGKELMAARSDPGAKGAVCAIKKTIEEGKVGPVLRAAGHPMIEETLDWLHMKFLSPIEEELASKLMQVWSTVLDFVVGLGGLIPEVGGIIADAIVVPINLLSTTLINPLVANLQGGVWKSARAQILKITTPVLDAVIDVIEKTADAAKDAAADGKTAVTALVADSKKFVTENQGIIANLFVPVFEKLTAVAFPGVPAMVKKCLKSSDDVLAIAGAGDKFCDALTPAELANVKVCCKTSMVCCQAPGMKAKMFNKCREQNKPAAGKCGKAENKVKKKKQCKSKQHEVDMEKCTGKTLFGSLKKKAGEAKDFVVKKAGEASDKFDDMKDSVKNSAVGKGAQKLLDSSIEGMAAGKKKAKEMKEEYDKVKEETLNKVADVKDEAKAKIEEAKAKFGELKDGAKAKVSELKAGLNDLKDDLKDEAKERIEEAKKKLGELKDEATAKVSELKDGAKAKAKELTDGAKKAGEKLKGLFGKKL